MARPARGRGIEGLRDGKMKVKSKFNLSADAISPGPAVSSDVEHGFHFHHGAADPGRAGRTRV